MHHSLVILIQRILLVCESIGLQRDHQGMRGLGWDLKILGLGFVRAFRQVKVSITFLRILAGFGVAPGKLPRVHISENVLVEAIQGLSLPLGCMEVVGVQPYGVMGTARGQQIGFVQGGPGSPPATIQQGEIEFRGK
jgi:hypothetical protein